MRMYATRYIRSQTRVRARGWQSLVPRALRRGVDAVEQAVGAKAGRRCRRRRGAGRGSTGDCFSAFALAVGEPFGEAAGITGGNLSDFQA